MIFIAIYLGVGIGLGLAISIREQEINSNFLDRQFVLITFLCMFAWPVAILLLFIGDITGEF